MSPTSLLAPVYERFRPNRIRNRPGAKIFKTVWEFETTSSTSTIAQEIASAAPADFHVVTALEQTQGRGQHGRSWASAKGRGLLISLVMPKDRPWSRPSIWCAWCATALADLVSHHTSVSPQIKWPNDILIEGKKVAGILVEQSAAVVAGIGLNVLPIPTSEDQPLWANACAIGDFATPAPLLEEVAEGLLQRLETAWIMMESGDFQDLENRFSRGLGMTGRRVLLETARENLSGRIQSIRLEEIRCETEGGAIRSFAPEEILHIYPIEEDF